MQVGGRAAWDWNSAAGLCRSARMSQWILSAKLVCLALFFISSLAIVGYEWRYVWPVKKCEEHGAWWDSRDRQCLTPMPIWRITNRKLPTPPAGPVAAKP